MTKKQWTVHIVFADGATATEVFDDETEAVEFLDSLFNSMSGYENNTLIRTPNYIFYAKNVYRVSKREEVVELPDTCPDEVDE